MINDTNQNEQAYYVNMVIAWFLCECYIKNQKETKCFLKNHQLNQFTLKKFISKCQDSFRISEKDKKQLKSFVKY